jgi:hypothetical protein
VTREQFEHAIRAAGAVLGTREVLCRAPVERGLVQGERLRQRLAMVSGLDARLRTAVLARIPS